MAKILATWKFYIGRMTKKVTASPAIIGFDFTSCTIIRTVTYGKLQEAQYYLSDKALAVVADRGGMPENRGDVAANANCKPKKANLLDHHSIKHLLDESVTEIVTGKGFPEDVRLSNVRLLIGSIIIIIALFAQFYKKKFPENRNFLIGCIVLYILFNVILLLIIYTKEKNTILFTHPPPDSFSSTGLVVSSKLPRFSDMYTFTIASADPKSISAKPSVELAKSVTQWFTKDGVLAEGLFWKDVEQLLNDYTKEGKKNKRQ